MQKTIVAYGTAVAIDNLFDDDTYVTIDELINRIDTFDRSLIKSIKQSASHSLQMRQIIKSLPKDTIKSFIS